MIEIPFSMEGGFGKVHQVLAGRHSRCYLCSETPIQYADYLAGEYNVEKDLGLFRELFEKNNLSYKIKDDEDGLVEISACEKHFQNLKSLDRKIIENKNKINEIILNENIKLR